ncbi:isochorismatase family protein [Jonesia quinghaiensis]|uniref:isochorismatase family protein n=1 Tax=Jonesia quinghaiensis TaxID=262806 RepID=UPI00041F1F50|nr:isochorismatase family protein [Jonesia quinghaiensis]
MAIPRRALIIVDVQNEYVDGPLEIQYPPHAESLPRIGEAIDAATAAGIPIVMFQHTSGEGAPVFDPTTPGFDVHPDIVQRQTPEWKTITKQYGTVFAGTDLLEWLRDHNVDTVTFVGYMTNNCILASLAESETHGLAAEVLSDATGAINIANAAGVVSAKTVHTTLMALFNSNFAAVALTDEWKVAVLQSESLAKDNLVSSAMLGATSA